MPFRCGSWSCPVCGPVRAAVVRAGVYRAVRALGLVDMVTLTLPPGARGSTPTESRTALLGLFNAFRTALRKRGFFGSYLWVPEAHEDGTAHLHVACDLTALRVAAGNKEWAAGIVAEAWGRLGGGFVSVTFGRGDGRTAAAYLSKYLGKAQGQRLPWEDVRYCTADGSFRLRPWHRFGGSRDVVSAMQGPELRASAGTWALVRASLDGAIWEPWNPARGSAIVAACDGHPPTPEWVPGDCHHGSGLASLGQCFCVPPWAYEPPWDLTSWGVTAKKALVSVAESVRTVADVLTEARAVRTYGPDIGPWWNAEQPDGERASIRPLASPPFSPEAGP